MSLKWHCTIVLPWMQNAHETENITHVNPALNSRMLNIAYLKKMCRETQCTICRKQLQVQQQTFFCCFLFCCEFYALVTPVLRLKKARLTLWQAHSNPLWHCERSAPGQLHSTPTGIQNQSPHGSLTNHPSIPRPVICTNMEHQTRGIRTGLNIGPVLQRWRLSPCT